MSDHIPVKYLQDFINVLIKDTKESKTHGLPEHISDHIDGKIFAYELVLNFVNRYERTRK